MEDSLGSAPTWTRPWRPTSTSYSDEWAATLRIRRSSRSSSRSSTPRKPVTRTWPTSPSAARTAGGHRREALIAGPSSRCGHGQPPDWVAVCTKGQLMPERGVAVLVRDQQVALFRVTGTPRPGTGDFVYAVGHRDPFADANVIARGIVGSVGRGDDQRDTVASPMYKHVFDLATGACLTDPVGPAPGLPHLDRRRCRLRPSRPLVPSALVHLRTPMTELTPVLAGTRILVTAQRRSDELAAALTAGRRGDVAPALGVVPSIDEDELLRRTREILADRPTPGGHHRDRLPRAGWTRPRPQACTTSCWRPGEHPARRPRTQGSRSPAGGRAPGGLGRGVGDVGGDRRVPPRRRRRRSPDRRPAPRRRRPAPGGRCSSAAEPRWCRWRSTAGARRPTPARSPRRRSRSPPAGSTR